MSAGNEIAEGKMVRRPAFLIPLLVFVALAVLLAIGLGLDPKLVPSPLIGKPVPQFDLPPVMGRPPGSGLATRDLKGEVALVNVFASWCTACREEHPLLMRMARDKVVPLHGINYKDRLADAARWLAELGDPYLRVGADLNGRVAIDWGVYGVPETFVIDREGRIAYKQIGALTPKALDESILPLIEKLRK